MKKVVMKKVLSCLAILALASAAGLAAEPEAITIGESLTLRSDVLDEDRDVFVSLPDDYAHSGTPYPVLYLLDGRTNFHHTTGTIDALSRVGHVPKLIVVAVTNTDRTRDLTPSPFTPDPDAAEGDGENPMPTAGGADKFLDFFEHELFAFVEQRYRTAPYRILVGHSFGGLFAIHALLARPASFDAYIAISPSLWWEDGELVDRAAKLWHRGTKTDAKTLYVSLASEGGDMLTSYQEFEDLLRYQAPANLTWKAMIMEGDDHGSTPLRSTYHGLRTVFPRWRVPRFLFQEVDLDGFRRHFTSLSKEYGYEIQVPENLVNRLGYRLMANDEVAQAIEVLRYNVAAYPGSANVYDSLGEALEADGQLKAALENFEHACRKAREIDDPNLSIYQEHRDKLRAKLASGS